MNYFTKLIKQHKDELDNPERGHDLMYEFLLERRKQLENGNHKTTFTGIAFECFFNLDLFIM